LCIYPSISFLSHSLFVIHKVRTKETINKRDDDSFMKMPSLQTGVSKPSFKTDTQTREPLRKGKPQYSWPP